jgi:hypothetical protein
MVDITAIDVSVTKDCASSWVGVEVAVGGNTVGLVVGVAVCVVLITLNTAETGLSARAICEQEICHTDKLCFQLAKFKVVSPTRTTQPSEVSPS